MNDQQQIAFLLLNACVYCLLCWIDYRLLRRPRWQRNAIVVLLAANIMELLARF